MHNYNSSEIINVGIGEDITIKALTEIIKKKLNFKGDILWDTTKPNGVPMRKLCTKKINNLGWFAKTSFDVGISKTIDWYVENKLNYYIN